MQSRLNHLIAVKANGNRSQFGRILGWSPQYLNSLLTGAIGIKPVTAILEAFPDISARWLILGSGDMYELEYDPLKRELMRLAGLDRYVRVMTAEEIDAHVHRAVPVTAEQKDRWNEKIKEKEAELGQRIGDAMRRSQRYE